MNFFQKQNGDNEQKIIKEIKIREEKIKKLQEEQNNKANKILHPLQSRKNNKEIKSLQKEIENIKNSEKNKKTGIICSVVVLILIAIMAIGTIGEKSSENETMAENASMVDETLQECATIESKEIVLKDISTQTPETTAQKVEKQTESEAVEETEIEIETVVETIVEIQKEAMKETSKQETISETVVEETKIIEMKQEEPVYTEEVQESETPQPAIEIPTEAPEKEAVIVAQQTESVQEEVWDKHRGNATFNGHYYGTDSGAKYHYTNECAGKNSHELTEAEAMRREPCGKCVLK